MTIIMQAVNTTPNSSALNVEGLLGTTIKLLSIKSEEPSADIAVP